MVTLMIDLILMEMIQISQLLIDWLKNDLIQKEMKQDN